MSLNEPDREVISCMAFRGWALYPAGSLSKISTVGEVRLIVEAGREKERLYPGWKYVPFPLCKKDTDWKLVSSLIEKVLGLGRGPFWVDIDNNMQVIGVYLIDSVVYNDRTEEILLVIDESYVTNGSKAVVLGEYDVPKIRKQMMLALRE